MQRKTEFDLVALCRKMEAAPNAASLRLYAEEAKTAPEGDKQLLRDVYMACLNRLKSLENASQLTTTSRR